MKKTCSKCQREVDSNEMFQCSGNTYECADGGSCYRVEREIKEKIEKQKEQERLNKLSEDYCFLSSGRGDPDEELQHLNINPEDIEKSSSQYRDGIIRHNRVGIHDKNEKFHLSVRGGWDIIIAKDYFKKNSDN